MPRPTTILALALVLAVTAQAGAQQTESADRWLTFRLTTPNVPDETLDYLAQILEPRKMVWHKGEAVYDLVRRAYGIASTSLQARVLTANHLSANAAATADRVVDIPPGPLWAGDVIRLVHPQTNAAVLMSKETGLAVGETQIEAFKEKNHGQDPFQVGAGHTVVIPNASGVLGYKLKNSAREESISVRLASLRGVSRPKIEQSLRLVPHWNLARVADENGVPCSDGKRMPASPLPRLDADTLEVIKRQGQAGNGATVAIVDSGIETDAKGRPIESRFPFWHRPSGDPQAFNFFGLNLPRHNDPLTDNRFRQDQDGRFYGSHGTHVAGLASGRLLAKEMALNEVEAKAVVAGLNRSIQLMILKVTDPDNDEGAVLPTFLSRAIEEAAGAQIINMSLAGPQDFGLTAMFQKASNTLFVIAAGNGNSDNTGIDIGVGSKVYPALYGKLLPDNVIVVAAHDGSERKALACFSNYGREEVDLAAPGVDVNSTITNGEFRISGTSQAAPIVSMTAALLYALGLKTPQQVKERILATVEPSLALVGKVRFEGALDVNKALAIRTDLVQKTDTAKAPLRGTVKPFSLHVDGENGAVAFTDIRRIVFNFPSAGTHRVWLVKPRRNGDPARLRYVDSKLTLTNIELKTATETLSILIDQLADITFAAIR